MMQFRGKPTSVAEPRRSLEHRLCRADAEIRAGDLKRWRGRSRGQEKLVEIQNNGHPFP